MANAEACERSGVLSMHIAEAVVRHDGFHPDTQGAQPTDRVLEEENRRRRLFVRAQFSVCHARRVIDGDVQILPSALPSPSLAAAVSGNAVPHTAGNAPELLRVDVQQLAW